MFGCWSVMYEHVLHITSIFSAMDFVTHSLVVYCVYIKISTCAVQRSASGNQCRKRKNWRVLKHSRDTKNTLPSRNYWLLLPFFSMLWAQVNVTKISVWGRLSTHGWFFVENITSTVDISSISLIFAYFAYFIWLFSLKIVRLCNIYAYFSWFGVKIYISNTLWQKDRYWES